MSTSEIKSKGGDLQKYEFDALDLTLENVSFDEKGLLLSGHVVNGGWDLIIFEGKWGSFLKGSISDFNSRNQEGQRDFFDLYNVNCHPISDHQRVARPKSTSVRRSTGKPPVSHVGIHAHRLHPDAGNELEVRFANGWKEMQKDTSALKYLLNRSGEPGIINPRDAEVAATVIQWLGSPVGSSFVRGVLEGFDHDMEVEADTRRKARNR